MSRENNITDYLIKHKKEQPLSFHVPGHKGRDDAYRSCGFAAFCEETLGNDITELAGADSLFAPESLILDLKKRYAELYGAKRTELLVNGATSGIMAAILACVPFGGTLMLGRNSNFAAFSAMRMGKIVPVYIRPEIDYKCKLQSYIEPAEIKRALRENPNTDAVLITSPNYYGRVSDIASIARICHDAGAVLIVDQSQGSHLPFFDKYSRLKRAAENLGADIVINETYRTLLSFTGTGILNICSDNVDADAVAEQLRMLQTANPYYPMLVSLDINEQIIRRWGRELVEKWKENVTYFCGKCKNIGGVELLGGYDMDMTHLNVSMASLGLRGDRLESILRHRGIWAEKIHGDYLLLLTGAGNRLEDYERLVKELNNIAAEYAIGSKHIPLRPVPVDFELEVRDIPMRREKLPLYAAEGRVLYDPIVTYPPGSPLACPGEILNLDVITHIYNAIKKGEQIAGVDDEGEIWVGTEMIDI